MNNYLLSCTSKIVPSFVTTHTRIPSKELNIYGGKYCIKDKEAFWKLYYDYVIVKGMNEYLTEVQDKNGVIAIDLDFRYNHDVDEKQHTTETIKDIILCIIEPLKKYYQFDSDSIFSVYIFEKPNVNRLEDGSLTKDGIHIIVGLNMNQQNRENYRKSIIKLLSESVELPLINTWESVVDEGVMKTSTNWCLYGSKKPAHDSYKLIKTIDITYDTTDKEFMCDWNENKQIHMSFELFKELSVQNLDRPNIPQILTLEKPQQEKPKSPTSVTQVPLTLEEENMSDIDYLLCVCIRDNLCKTKEHEGWNKIGQALKNELGDQAVQPFINWTYKFGSPNKQNEALNQITKYIKKTPLSDKKRLTLATVHFYARKYNEEKYKQRFCKKTEFVEDELLENIIFEVGDYAYATYFTKKYGSYFKCVSIKDKNIYQFNSVKIWDNNFEGGSKIREMISNEMYNDFKQYLQQYELYKSGFDKHSEEHEHISRKIKKMSEVLIKLQKTTDKNNILKEIMDKIEDPDFEKKINKELYLLPIKYGKVLNMKTLEKHDRTMEHYFSYECNADYIEMTAEQENDIKQYFLDLFCGKEDTMKCVLDILKSILTGETLRYIYFFTGSGSNGKSLLFNILNQIFKKAMDTIDTRVILELKGSSDLTTQFEKLDKCRIGYVTELKETDKMNETIIKKISGGDAVDFRGLYKTNKTMKPTCNLCVLTNELPTFKVEKAILNRLVVIPFNNVFKTDKSFEKKMLDKSDQIFSFIMKHGNICDEFNLTEEMLIAKQEYKEDNEKIDYLQDFININYTKVEFVKKEKVTREKFREAYNIYLKTRGQPIDKSTPQKFSRLIKNYGIGLAEGGGKTYYTGLIEKEIKEDDDDDDEI